MTRNDVPQERKQKEMPDEMKKRSLDTGMYRKLRVLSVVNILFALGMGCSEYFSERETGVKMKIVIPLLVLVHAWVFIWAGKELRQLEDSERDE